MVADFLLHSRAILGEVKQEHPTLDGATFYRCMIVGFEESFARECSRAVRPLEAVRFGDVREACVKMSEVLPLIVLYPDNPSASGFTELVDLAGACGAEALPVALPVDPMTLNGRILEALNKAEGRRRATR